MPAVLGVTHVHKGSGPIRQLHHSSGVVVYSNHLASLQHLSYSLTHYVVQLDTLWGQEVAAQRQTHQTRGRVHVQDTSFHLSRI